jgi:signal transduction histidine kinase
MMMPEPRTAQNSFDPHAVERVLDRAARTLRDFAGRSDDRALATVTHDLRDPMNTLVMSTSLLSDSDIHLSEEQRRVQFAVIERAIQRMNRLIEKLVDYKRTG